MSNGETRRFGRPRKRQVIDTLIGIVSGEIGQTLAERVIGRQLSPCEGVAGIDSQSASCASPVIYKLCGRPHRIEQKEMIGYGPVCWRQATRAHGRNVLPNIRQTYCWLVASVLPMAPASPFCRLLTMQ